MIRNDLFAVYFVSFYLLVYVILLHIASAVGFAFMMFALSPFFVLWMVYTVLRHGKYTGPELGNKEFGYQDRENSSNA